MNFKFKSLVAALLAVASVSANAAISTNDGNGEFVFSAWDGDKGYTFDLDTSLFLNDFIGGDLSANATNNATLLANAKVGAGIIGAGGVIYDSALTGFGTAFSNAGAVEWNLVSVDNVGRTRMLTTADSVNAASPASTNNNAMKGSVTNNGLYFPQADSFITVPATDTFAITASTDGGAYAGNMGNNYGFLGFDTTNGMGSQSFMYMLGQTTQASSIAPSLFQQLTSFDNKSIFAKTYQGTGGEWRLQLAVTQDVVAAVPEPESYAMMLAGLAMLGGVSRRRNNKA